MTSIVSGEFCTFRHIKTRKAFVIEVEFPEEQGQEVLRVLGMPIGGESKHVAVALLEKSVIRENGITGQSANNAQSNSSEKPNSSEGEKLRVRAVMLGKDTLFQGWVSEFTRHPNLWFEGTEQGVKSYIYHVCGIKSRSTLAHNETAQTKFKELLAKFDSWKLESQYAENLNRL